jgi:NAD/NADP transhydrogenase alpha subunit
MELVPRISRAQSMDALSSQAMVSGYRCAIVAASVGDNWWRCARTSIKRTVYPVQAADHRA